MPDPTIELLDTLPYGRQTIEEDDIAAVCDVLRSQWLTTGPTVARFEQELAAFVGTRQSVAVSSGTAALHTALAAVGVDAGDEVIVPALTFAATANAAVYLGARPVFADVSADTLLVDPASIAARITRRTKAIVTVDYAGQPAPYDEINTLAERQQVPVIADACHALGATDHGEPVGSRGELNCFSFHPVKSITTAEGGAITTNNGYLAERMRAFRNHGFDTDHRQRAQRGRWNYAMTSLGFNYRLSDLQCALGIAQLRKLPTWIEQRQNLAARYAERLADIPGVTPLALRGECTHAYHLFVVRIDAGAFGRTRDEVFSGLAQRGIRANVHYLPVYLHPFYEQQFGSQRGTCPQAEAAFEGILTLPLFPRMRFFDVERVVGALREIRSGG